MKRFHRFLAEVSVREHKRGHQGPDIDGQSEPAGADLHPHCRHGALHGLVVWVGPDEPRRTAERSQCRKRVSLSVREEYRQNAYLLVPVGEGHHDVEGGQKEADVEEGVAVGDRLPFVVHGPSGSVLPYRSLHGGQTLILLGLHQLVHLGVVGWANTVADKGTFSPEQCQTVCCFTFLI